MAMQPGGYQQMLWQGLDPEQQRKRTLASAYAEAQRTGDYTQYKRLMWEGLNGDQRQKRTMEAAQANYRNSDAYYTDMFKNSPRGAATAQNEIAQRKRRLATGQPQ
jgi:hypothetical protein